MRHTCSQIKSNPIITAAAETLAYKALENTVLKGHCLLLKWIAADLQRTTTGQQRTASGLQRTASGLQRTATGQQRTTTGLDRNWPTKDHSWSTKDCSILTEDCTNCNRFVCE